MINDIFTVFGDQTAAILLEIITECMDDYLYIIDLQSNTMEISQSAVNRFQISENVMTDVSNDILKVVYEEDRETLIKHLADIREEKKRYIIFITDGLAKMVCRYGSIAVAL